MPIEFSGDEPEYVLPFPEIEKFVDGLCLTYERELAFPKHEEAGSNITMLEDGEIWLEHEHV